MEIGDYVLIELFGERSMKVSFFSPDGTEKQPLPGVRQEAGMEPADAGRFFFPDPCCEN